MDNPYASPKSESGLPPRQPKYQTPKERERRWWRAYVAMHAAVVFTCLLLWWPIEDRPLVEIVAGSSVAAWFDAWPLASLQMVPESSAALVPIGMVIAPLGYIRAKQGRGPGVAFALFDILLVPVHIGALYPGIL